MKAFIAALVVAIGLAVGTAVVLGTYQRDAQQAYTTQGVRL